MEFHPTGEHQNEIVRRTQTVLLGDDDEGIRHLLAELLCDAGFEVIEAESRQRAVEIFQERQGAVDLVLLDMSESRLTAEAALDRLRRTNSSAKVLLITGNVREEELAHAMEKGFNALISKPFTLSELLNPLLELVGNGICPAVAV